VDERPIRLAASAICVRASSGTAGAPEVLVIQRSSASRFLPGYVAFPGGAVDREDEENAGRWFGDEVHAQRATAVRELTEEVGLALTADGLVRAADLTDVDGAPPAAEQLHEMARWVAPRAVPVRFDARYYAVPAGHGVDPTPDGAEAAHAWWAPATDLLLDAESGVRKLYWPTLFTVRQLAACTSVEDVLSLTFETREPTEEDVAVLPRAVMEQVP
jgi:8-oxo-dGTP pyrophosphatase MutT (NUDIX family)